MADKPEKQNFKWCIDSDNYLHGKQGDKLLVKDFVKHVAGTLNSYCGHSVKEVFRMPHNHRCPDLDCNKSPEAKKLCKRFEEINAKLGESRAVMLHASDRVQLGIKGVSGKDGFRCFGYIIEDENLFHLIYLDPKHEIYKES